MGKSIYILQDAKWEASRCQLPYLVQQRRVDRIRRIIVEKDSGWRMVMLLRTGRQREEIPWIREGVERRWKYIHRWIQRWLEDLREDV
jgi:hypothetical protein